MARYPRGPRVRIDVTREQIEFAKPRDSSHCMIAEAVKAAVPWARRVSVDLQTIRFSDPDRGLRFTYLTPRSAQIALVGFDQGLDVAPFSIRLQNAHVTASAAQRKKVTVTEAGKQARQQNVKKAHAASAKAIPRRATMATRGNDHHGSIPEVVGGKPPPSTPFARRRAFGLRGLER